VLPVRYELDCYILPTRNSSLNGFKEIGSNILRSIIRHYLGNKGSTEIKHFIV
jgi:hypothetical protein